MKHLTLYNSTRTATVDDADYHLVSMHQWRAVTRRNKTYAATRINGRTKFLHRLIMGEPRGKLIDHEDGDGLSCIRSNLRECTRSQNMGNQKKHRDRTGKYKGVYFDKAKGKYAAQICVNRKTTKIGRFTKAIDAARAYDQAAIALFGEFARVNFPQPKQQLEPLTA